MDKFWEGSTLTLREKFSFCLETERNDLLENLAVSEIDQQRLTADEVVDLLGEIEIELGIA